MRTANFYEDDSLANGYNDGYATTGSNVLNPSSLYLTDVGAYTASVSPYGTFDQGGNVWEWTEGYITEVGGRTVLGGSFSFFSDDMSARNWFVGTPDFQLFNTGFRVAASIPEPSTSLLVALMAAGLLMRRRV